MKKTLLYSVLLTGVTGVALWQLGLGNDDETGATRSVDLSNKVAPVAATVNNTTQEPALLNSDEPLTGTTITNAPTTSQHANRDEIADTMKQYIASAKPGEVMEYYAQLRRARAELVQNQMNGEASDPAWEADVTSRFEFARSLSARLADLQIRNTDCRQTICAVHLQLGAGQYTKLRPFLQHIGSAMGSDAFVLQDASPDEATVYLARAETKLPALDLSN